MSVRARLQRAPSVSVWRAAALAAALLSLPQPSIASQDSGAQGPYKQLLQQYCVPCHNQRVRTQGLALDTVDLSQIAGNADMWEKVIRKLRSGAMPPAGARRPSQTASNEFGGWLENEIDRAAAARPNPGRTETWHRLNRTEYGNAVRDLLAVEQDVTSLLPADDASYGFDNIAGVLKISPTL